MDYITSLVRAPEVLDEILSYLPDARVLELAFTCKTLYASCSRYLWSNLRVTGSIYSTSGRIISPRLRFPSVIEDYWSESDWIKYTRYLVCGRIMNFSSKEIKAIIDLLNEQRLRPNRIDFEIFLTAEDITPRPEREFSGSLCDLKKYSESRLSQEFSILLQSNVVHSLPKLVDLEKVTKLTLGFLVEPLDDYSIAKGIEDLTLVLEESINLTQFSWEALAKRNARCEISTIDAQLQKLQTAVDGLRHLRNLRIHRYLFHPSFFLVPPENVRVLSLDCIASEDWWLKFASCPLSNVEILSINYVTGCDSADGLEGFVDQGTTKFDTLVLEDVAVRSLKKFSCNRSTSNIPYNLRDCMLRNNTGLDLGSRTQMKRQEAVNLIAECQKLYDQEYRACLELAVPRYTKKFAEGYVVDVEKALDFLAEWAEILTLIVQPNYLEKVENWVRDKELAEGIAENDDEITGDVIEKARNFVVPLVFEFSGALRGVKERVIDAMAKRLAKGEDFGIKAAMGLLVEDVVMRIRNVRQGIRDYS
ncbi:hypothetical protein TWF718_004122 [Orbilia javanica]|uniref:F-box domain-containing protein n=1 Tax=Orbilia javanica TaxID=47235 RepID=A0AAN8MX65_9PEZI